MAFYEEMAALAVEMLAEFGGPAQLTRSAPTTGAFDKTTGRPTGSAAPTSVAVTTVVAPQAFETEDGRKEVRTVATMLTQPNHGDKLTMGSQVWIIGNVTKIAPIGTPIVFFAEVA